MHSEMNIDSRRIEVRGGNPNGALMTLYPDGVLQCFPIPALSGVAFAEDVLGNIRRLSNGGELYVSAGGVERIYVSKGGEVTFIRCRPADEASEGLMDLITAMSRHLLN